MREEIAGRVVLFAAKALERRDQAIVMRISRC
jgi:hypothetical protein